MTVQQPEAEAIRLHGSGKRERPKGCLRNAPDLQIFYDFPRFYRILSLTVLNA